MSLWDKYFAPGDVRRQRQQQQLPLPPQPISPTQPPTTSRTTPASPTNYEPQPLIIVKNPPPSHSTLPPSTLTPTPQPSQQPPSRLSPSDRTRRQNALLYGGLAFTALSLFVTRRALARKNAQMRAQAAAAALAAANPKTPASAAAIAEGTKVDGTLEAVQALGYATLNVFSTAMLAVGAGMVYFDVADLEDLRAAVRGRGGYGGLDDEASEREIVGVVQGWVDEVRGRGGAPAVEVERDVERERREMRREIEGEVRRRLEEELRRVSAR